MLIILISNLAWGAGVGTTGANYLKIDAGARSSALGSAYVGLADDLNSLYFNPAGIASISYPAVDTMQLNWLADITQQQLAGVYPIKGWGVLGAYYSALVTPYDKETTYDSGNDYYATGKEFNSEIKVVDIAYAQPINENFSAGLGVKSIKERLADVEKSGIAADVGFLYRGLFIKDLSVGLVAQNISITPLRPEEPLPQATVVGLAYPFRLFGTQKLTVLGDVGFCADNVTAFGGGIEYALNQFLAFRIGYKSKVGYTLGGGLRFGNLNLNYAYVPYGELGTSYRIALGYDFAPVEEMKNKKDIEQPAREYTKEELFEQPKQAVPVTPSVSAPAVKAPAAKEQLVTEDLFQEESKVESKKETTPAKASVAPEPARTPTVSAELDGLFD